MPLLISTTIASADPYYRKWCLPHHFCDSLRHTSIDFLADFVADVRSCFAEESRIELRSVGGFVSGNRLTLTLTDFDRDETLHKWHQHRVNRLLSDVWRCRRGGNRVASVALWLKKHKPSRSSGTACPYCRLMSATNGCYGVPVFAPGTRKVTK